LTLFQDRCDGIFTGRQARDLLMDVIINKVHSFSINKGLYFVDSGKVRPVLSLVDALNSVDPGINVIAAPILKFNNNPSLNAGFNSVQQNLSNSVLKSVSQFKAELENLRDKDSDTRGATWDNYVEEMSRLKKQISEYRDKELIQNDIIEDVFNECREIIMQSRFK